MSDAPSVLFTCSVHGAPLTAYTNPGNAINPVNLTNAVNANCAPAAVSYTLLLCCVAQAITGTNASADPLYVDGHVVYSAYFEGGMGFRNNVTRNVPVGDEPETIYMVTSGTHYNDHCCFDYGNAEIGTWSVNR